MPFQFARRNLLAGVAATALFFADSTVHADEPLDVVATFSILGDLTREVGGDRINLVTLVGADEDAHAFSPEPSHARALAEADLVIVNGLGFEGWMERLVSASGYEGPVTVATTGVPVLDISDDHDEHDGDAHAHDDDHDAHDHDEHEGEEHAMDDAHDHDAHDHGDMDPHAWQDIANAHIYVENIAEALSDADPAGREIYESNAARYVAELDALEAEIHAAMDRIDPSRRTVVTSHDAFGYLGNAYGITFLAPEGMSTDGEPSASAIAGLIRQIRDEEVTAVFLENITDDRMIERIVAETDAQVGGTLYSDALSGTDGPASTYLAMMRHNTLSLAGAMQAF